jgi:hypothetical protein
MDQGWQGRGHWQAGEGQPEQVLKRGKPPNGHFRKSPCADVPCIVMPAKAGIQSRKLIGCPWTPAFAGVTVKNMAVVNEAAITGRSGGNE